MVYFHAEATQEAVFPAYGTIYVIVLTFLTCLQEASGRNIFLSFICAHLIVTLLEATVLHVKHSTVQSYKLPNESAE